MKIRTKITIINIIILLVAVSVTLAVLLSNVLTQKTSEIEKTREFEMERTKDYLRSTMDIGFNILENNYLNTSNKTHLVRTYGGELVDAINMVNLVLQSHSGSSDYENYVLACKSIRHGHIVCWIADSETGKILAANSDSFPFDGNKTAAAVLGSLSPDYGFEMYISSQLPRLLCVKKDPSRKIIVAAGLSESFITAQAQEKSKEQIRNVIFNEGSGYLYAFNTACINMVHPYLQHLENTDFSYVKDSHGKRLVQEMVNLVLKQDEGFVSYYWPKPRKNKPDVPDVPKITYAKLFKPWMWMLSTGAYVDNIDEIVNAKSEAISAHVDTLVNKTIINTIVITIILLLFSIYFSASISRPIEQLTRAMEDVNVNQMSSHSISLRGSAEIVQLGRIFNRMLKNLDDNLIRIKEAFNAKERAETELSVAHEIQTEIIPQLFPPIQESPVFEPYVMNFRAENGGNTFYETQLIAPDKLCIVAGDISRSGLPASMYTIVVRTLLRTSGMRTDNPGLILNEVNGIITRNRHMNTYISLFLGVFNLKTGELHYSNAGHAFPVIIRRLRDLEEIPTIHGSPLGLQRDISYLSDMINVNPGDIIVLYSNGLIPLMKNIHGKNNDMTLVKNMLALNLRANADDTMFNTEKYLEDVVGGVEIEEDVMILGVYYRGNAAG